MVRASRPQQRGSRQPCIVAMSLAKPYIPCSQYLIGAWLEAVQPVVQWAKLHMSAVKGKTLCMDHTFKLAKYMVMASKHTCVH